MRRRQCWEEPPEEVRTARHQCADGAGQVCDGVVPAEGSVAPRQAARRLRDHRLLQRRDRPRLIRFDADRARERGQQEEGEPFREGEHGPGGGHQEQEPRVQMAAADPVAPSTDRDRHQREPGQHRGQDQPDLRVGVARVRQLRADQHTAEPVQERAQRLDQKDRREVPTALRRGRFVHAVWL